MYKDTDKIIFHVDMNNFFASVECVLNPALKGFPVAVSGNPLKRSGVILAKNYLAKAYGIKTAETIYTAKTKCPQLICVAPHYDKYEEFSMRAKEIYLTYTDKIESMGLDECWLDLSESLKYFKKTPKQLAIEIQNRIYNELGLTVSIGVSFSKTLAKLGSDMIKPSGLVEISRDNHIEFLKKLKISDMIFVGKRTEQVLKKMNINTLFDLYNYNADLLKARFGINGTKLHDMVSGENDDIVSKYDEHEVKSVGNGLTTPKDLTTKQEVSALIYKLSTMVSTRLREKNKLAKTVHLGIKFSDFSHYGEQKSFNIPFSSTEQIARYAIRIFENYELKNDGFNSIRAIRVSVSGLIDDKNLQLSIFDDERKRQNLSKAIDELKSKYGEDAIFFPDKKYED